MSPADVSIFVFGIYLFVIVGIGFVVIPNTVLKLFRIPETKEVWIRILGFMIAMLGVFNIVGGLYHLTAFAWATVFERCAVVGCLITVALLRQTKSTIVLFGVVDFAGALWTFLALLRGAT